MMLRLQLFLFCLSMSFSVLAQDISQISARKFILQVLKIYSPEHHTMLELYNQTPSQVSLSNATFNVGRPIDFMMYIQDTTRQELILNNMPTMIHEMVHSYTHRAAYKYLADNKLPYQVGAKYSLYYINPNESIFLEQRKTPPVNVIQELVPPEIRTENYNSLIASDNPSLLTYKDGLYGLLNEWNAYYHETLLSFELKEFYERTSFENMKNWEHFFANYYQYHTHYLEFKYYILLYLKYLRAHDLKLYKEFQKDANFKKAFWTIDKHYAQIGKDFEKYKPLVTELLKKYGVEMKEEELDGMYILFLNDVGIDTNLTLENAISKEIENADLQEVIKDFKK